jgi:hypothetical protein
LPGVRVLLGEVDGFDLEARTVGYTDPTAARPQSAITGW